VHRAREAGELGRHRLGAGGRQEREAAAERLRGVGDGTAPEVDRALAVLPGEPFLRDGDITSRWRHAAPARASLP